MAQLRVWFTRERAIEGKGFFSKFKTVREQVNGILLGTFGRIYDHALIRDDGQIHLLNSLTEADYTQWVNVSTEPKPLPISTTQPEHLWVDVVPKTTSES